MPTMPKLATSEAAVRILGEVADMLREKNASYGDSAATPVRIFSQASAEDGIRIRIDDKLCRLARGRELAGEDTIRDLIGYLALLLAVRGIGRDEREGR